MKRDFGDLPFADFPVRSLEIYEAALAAPDREILLAVISAFDEAWPALADTLPMEEAAGGRTLARTQVEASLYVRERDAALQRVLTFVRGVLDAPERDLRGAGLRLIAEFEERAQEVVQALLETRPEPPPDVVN